MIIGQTKAEFAAITTLPSRFANAIARSFPCDDFLVELPDVSPWRSRMEPKHARHATNNTSVIDYRPCAVFPLQHIIIHGPDITQRPISISEKRTKTPCTQYRTSQTQIPNKAQPPSGRASQLLRLLPTLLTVSLSLLPTPPIHCGILILMRILPSTTPPDGRL